MGRAFTEADTIEFSGGEFWHDYPTMLHVNRVQ